MCPSCAAADGPTDPCPAPARSPPPGCVSFGSPPRPPPPKVGEVLKIFQKRMERWKITPSSAGGRLGTPGPPQAPRCPAAAGARRLLSRAAQRFRGYPCSQPGWASRPAEPPPLHPCSERASCAPLSIPAHPYAGLRVSVPGGTRSSGLEEISFQDVCLNEFYSLFSFFFFFFFSPWLRGW